MKKHQIKKTAAVKVSKPSKKTAAKESPILKDVKQLYSFMQDNNLESIEYDQKGLYLRLVKAKPAMIPVPVNVGGNISEGSANAQPAQEQYKEVIKWEKSTWKRQIYIHKS